MSAYRIASAMLLGVGLVGYLVPATILSLYGSMELCLLVSTSFSLGVITATGVAVFMYEERFRRLKRG